MFRLLLAPSPIVACHRQDSLVEAAGGNAAGEAGGDVEDAPTAQAFVEEALAAAASESTLADMEVGDVASAHEGERAHRSDEAASAREPNPPGASSSSSAAPPRPTSEQLAPVNSDVLSGTRMYTSSGGRISFYSHFGGAKRFFECECPNKAQHGRCVLTRMLPTHFNAKVANRGRLLGYLVAWLNAGHDVQPCTKQGHRAFKPSIEARLAAREELQSSDAGLKLLSVERARLPDEPVEHLDLFE